MLHNFINTNFFFLNQIVFIVFPSQIMYELLTMNY